MKNITKTFIALFAILSIACSSDDDKPVISLGAPPVLSAPAGNPYTLLIENAASQAENFKWTAADFNNNVSILYTIEIDKAGNAFANPQSLGTITSGYELPVTVESLNAAVLKAGGVAFVTSEYEVRIKASVNTIFQALYSNVATITVTPYIAVNPKLFLVGNSQQYYGVNAWDNTTALPMRYIGNGTTKVFEAYVKVGLDNGNPAGFKFIGQQGTWDNGNYGTIGGMQDGNLENSGSSGDIKLGTTEGPGFYYIQVNLDTMKYKSAKMKWGIIGDSTPGGWDAETPMTYDFDANKFVITTTLGSGELKFRDKTSGQLIYAADWKFSTGNSDPKVAYDVNAPNFPVTAGSHTIGLAIGFDGTATVTGL